MILCSLLLGLIVGIAETCPTKDNVFVRGTYAEAVRKAGDIPIVICRTAKPEDLDRILAGLDLLILPGGEDVDPALYGETASPHLGTVNATRDAFEQTLLRAAVRREVPIFGTCRGHQHLNVFFGGTLYQDLPTDLGPRSTVRHRPGDGQRHSIDILPGSRLAAACGAETMSVNSSHHQAVKGLAPGMTVTAWAPDGVVEAIECGWYPAAGVQFHPEGLNGGARDPAWERLYANLRLFAGRRPQAPLARRPVGVIASGVGGLAVLERLLTLDAFDNRTGEAQPDGRPDFEGEDFVCFVDLANGPYEGYERAGKADFLRELVVRDAQFVLGSEEHDPAKIVVIADRTATACGFARVKAMARPHEATVLGVGKADAGGGCPKGVSLSVDDAAVGCYRSLRAAGLLHPDSLTRSPTARRVKMFVSVGAKGPLGDDVKFGREVGCRDLGTRIVPLSKAALGEAVLDSMRKRCPSCARDLGL